MGFGYIDNVHGNVLSSEHYESMQGKTITDIVFFMPEGTMSFAVDVYVPVFFTSSWFTVGENGKLDLAALSAPIVFDENVDVPADYVKELKVKNSSGEYVDGFTVSDDFSTIYWSEDLQVASYTFEIWDANGVYMTYTSTATLATDAIPVEFQNDHLDFHTAMDIISLRARPMLPCSLPIQRE